MEVINLICADPDCFCEDVCCQECKDVLTCENKCKAVQYQEKIYTDETFFVDELNKLAEEKDSWLMAVAAEAVKCYVAQLAEAQADNMALVEALRKSLLLWKGWGNNNYAEDACYQSNLKVLEQPHPGDSLRKELKELQEGKAIYEAYDGSKLDKADQYIERLEKELEQYKRALELCCRAHRPTEARLQGMINGFLAQAKTGEANA